MSIFPRIIRRLGRYGLLSLRTVLSTLYDDESFKKEVEIYRMKVERLKESQKGNFEEIIDKVNNSKVSISVITPSFNAASFLPKVLDSLRKQTLSREIEWIIVDDCSNDDSMVFYKKLSHESKIGRIRVFRNKSNFGAGLSLKRGFNISSADIVSWISADDFYVSEKKLENDLCILRKEEADIVFSKYMLYGSDLSKCQKIVMPVDNFLSNKYCKFLLIAISNPLNGSSVVMKKDTYFECGGFNEFLVNVDVDLDLWIRAILLDKKFAFSETTVFNAHHDKQTSKNIWSMSIGGNLTRLSYVRFLEKMDEIMFLSHELSKMDGFDKAILNPFFNYRFVWILKLFEADIDKFKKYNQLFERLPDDIKKFQETIYQLSDEFISTPVFKNFANYYTNSVRKEC